MNVHVWIYGTAAISALIEFLIPKKYGGISTKKEPNNRCHSFDPTIHMTFFDFNIQRN